MQNIDRFKTSDASGNIVFPREKFIRMGTNDHRYMPGQDESLDIDRGGRGDKPKRGWDQLERRYNREILNILLLCGEYRCGDRRGSRFEANSNEYYLFFRIVLCEGQCIERRIDDLR